MRVCMLEGGYPRAFNCAWTAQSLGLASCWEFRGSCRAVSIHCYVNLGDEFGLHKHGVWEWQLR